MLNSLSLSPQSPPLKKRRTISASSSQDKELVFSESEKENSNNFNNATPSSSQLSIRTANSTTESIESRIKFATLCNVFELILTKKSHNERIDVLEQFWSKIIKNVDGMCSLFPFMRLTLPHLDRDRHTYGLKESKIAKCYIEILCLSESSADAQRLKKWKDPGINGGKQEAQLSFSDVVYGVLKKKGWSVQNQAQGTAKEFSISEMNSLLDDLTRVSDLNEKKGVLMKILKSSTALEQKWLIRIILKDMRMHLKHESILKALHPYALDLYNACTDLKEVCEKCMDPKFVYKSSTSIKVFYPLKPMLALLANEKLKTLLKSDPYVLEPKFDGERIMIHKEGSMVKFFTRNSKDYTNIYGPKFSSTISKHVNAKSCILDGEMLVWNSELGAFKEFGHNKTFALSEEESKTEQLCYMAFDIVHLNGNDLSGHSYLKRRKYLEKIIKQEEKTIEIVSSRPVESEKDVYDALDAAIMNRDEGIILKNVESTYVPGERKFNWLKLKPDHMDGLGETMDLLIIGGYYGTKFGRRSISHFLLGLAVPPANGEKPEIFHSFCKVGSGYTDNELTALQAALAPHWKKYNKSERIPFLAGWEPQAGEIPDVYIHPSNSKVLEVKASQVHETTKFRAGMTLRFPRVKRIRTDKEWYDANDLNTLQEIVRMSSRRQKKLSEMDEEEIMSDKKAKNKHRAGASGSLTPNIGGVEVEKKKWKREVTAVGHAVDTDTRDVVKESNIFKAKEFTVLSSDNACPKTKLERLIVQHGGTKVQNPTAKTDFIIAANKTIMKVKNWIEACEANQNPYGDKDVIHYSWVLDSIQEKKFLPLHPKYMIYTSKATTLVFKEDIDQYGDSFREFASTESLRHSLNEVKKLLAEEFKPLSAEGIAEMNAEFSIQSKLQFMKGTSIYLDRYSTIGDTSTVIEGSPLEMTETWLKLYGSTIVSSIKVEDHESSSQKKHKSSGISNTKCTHIIVNKQNLNAYRLRDLYNYSAINKVKLVDAGWVSKSVEMRQLQDEVEYIITKSFIVDFVKTSKKK